MDSIEELAAYGEFAGVVGRILPVDEEADTLAAEYAASRGEPQLRPLTRRCDVPEEQVVAPPELEWRSVKNTGACDAPEMVVAAVPGGRIFAGTVWDHVGNDGPQGGWHLLFVPDSPSASTSPSSSSSEAKYACGKAGCRRPATGTVQGSLLYHVCDEHRAEIKELVDNE